MRTPSEIESEGTSFEITNWWNTDWKADEYAEFCAFMKMWRGLLREGLHLTPEMLKSQKTQKRKQGLIEAALLRKEAIK